MSGIGPFAPGSLEDKVLGVLRTIYDPEIPVDIFEVGLSYDIDADAAANVSIRMTLTSPMCPVAESLPVEVETKVKALSGVASVKVEIVWEPPWGPDMMSEAARLDLGMM